jgi:hypothetical protein
MQRQSVSRCSGWRDASFEDGLDNPPREGQGGVQCKAWPKLRQGRFGGSGLQRCKGGQDIKGVVNGASSAEVSPDSRVLTGWAAEAIWRQFQGPGAILHYLVQSKGVAVVCKPL